MKRIRHVAVLIESSRAAGRGLIEGVARYSQECRSWSLYFEPRGLETALPRWLKNWKGDGILARLDNRQMADAAFASGVPVVDLRGALIDERFSLIVRSDNEGIAKLAFDHLRGQGLQQFAFCGVSPGANKFLDQRRAAFLELVGNRASIAMTFPHDDRVGELQGGTRNRSDRRMAEIAREASRRDGQ